MQNEAFNTDTLDNTIANKIMNQPALDSGLQDNNQFSYLVTPISVSRPGP